MQRIGKRKMIFSFVFVYFALFYTNLFAKTYPEQGSPFIQLYTSNDYGGGPQVFSCVQDSRGMIYVGDGNGIIEFNGTDWKIIRNTNNSLVRSMAADSLGRVYVGASNDFGYLQPNAIGEMEYVSLAQPIVKQGIKFYDIWKVAATSKGVFFFANKYVFKYLNNEITTIAVDLSVQDAYSINDQVYLPSSKGLCLLNGSTLISITEKDFFSIVPFSENKSLAINGQRNLCFINLLTGKSEELKTPVQKYFENHRINSLTKIDSTRFAVVTETGEIIILSNSGEFIQIINKERGLFGGRIYSVFVDNAQNLWVCMSKGVAKVDISFPALNFDERLGVNGNLQTTCSFKGSRYIGTLDGIYALPKFNIDKIADNNQFTKVKGFDGECWDLKVVDNRLYAICSSCLCVVDGTVARNIYNIEVKQAAHCFNTSPLFPNVFFIGMRGRLIAVRLKVNGNTITMAGEYDFPEITEKIRRINFDKDGNLWLNTQFDGIYFIRFINNDIKNYRVTLLGEKNGLPNLDGTKIYKANNEIVVTTNSGILKPEFSENNPTADSLIQFKYTSVFGDKINEPTALIASISDNKYLILGNGVYYATIKNQEIEFDTCGFSRLAIAHSISKAFANADSSISFCATDAYLYYNAKTDRDFRKPFNAIISKVDIDNDSTIFGGCFFAWNDSTQIASLIQTPEFVPTIDYKYNSITFHFSGLFYEAPDITEFQYQLVGFDKDWSNSSTENKAVYTNLHEGKYTFRVKARNVYGAQSNVAEYHFIITSPWYRSWWAISIYILLSIGVIYSAMWLYARRLKLQKEYLELIVEERTGEIIEQARELKTINEKLVEMDKFKQGVTSMIVHDLKNPINSIINSSDKQPEAQLKRIRQTGRQMLNLVLNILDVSKYEETKIELTITNHNLLKISLKAIEQVLFLSTEKNITISNLIKPELGIRAEAEMIERVFVNILTNAIKFTTNNGLIVIQAERKGEEEFLRISIADNGSGIPADKTHLVFQKFGQVVAKNSGSVRSTGLGLTYCKMVIEAHGGSIGVESELENGSTFWFTLPASTNVEVFNQPTPIAETISYIELSKVNRALLKEQLEELHKIEFYKITELFVILEKIEDAGNDEIKQWKQVLINAIDSGNESNYTQLL